MGLSLKDLGNIAVGAIERDRELTMESSKARAADLIANRDLVIRMKEKKYDSELKRFEVEDKKARAVQAVNAKYAGQEISPLDWGTDYLKETDKETYNNLLKNYEGNPDGLNNVLRSYYSDSLAKFEVSKSRDDIDKQIQEEVKAISSDYRKQIENAQGDSFLIGQLIGKRNKKINKVTEEIKEGSNGTKLVKEIQKEIEEKKELPFTIKKEDNVVTVPTWFITNGKVEEKRNKLNNADSLKTYEKANIAMLQKFLMNNKFNNINKVVKKDRDGQYIALEGPGISISNHIKLLSNGVVSSITDEQIFNETNRKASSVSDVFNPQRIESISDERIRDYTNIKQKDKWFTDDENIVAFVPWSVVNSQNSLLGNTFETKAERKLVGEAYVQALEIITANRNKNQDGKILEPNQKFMNDLQSELLSLKNGSNVTSKLVQELMLKTLNLTEKDLTGKSIVQKSVGQITITDPVSKKSKIVYDTEANKKLAKEKGFTIEIVEEKDNSSSSGSNEEIKQEIKKEIKSIDSDEETGGPILEPAIDTLIKKAVDGTITDSELIELGELDFQKVPPKLRMKYWKAKGDKQRKINQERNEAFNKKARNKKETNTTSIIDNNADD